MEQHVFSSVSQGILAKLLATENITVHIGNYETAFFDVQNRLLGLPTWNTSSKNISDLLVGHEVGHALFTELDDFQDFLKNHSDLPKQAYNIVEDIRIERKIQSRYPGLISIFDRAYAELLDRDFFKIKGKDVDKMCFGDRINLKAKCGNKIDVHFSPEEQVLFDECMRVETYEDVVNVIRKIKWEIEKSRTQFSNAGKKSETVIPSAENEPEESTTSQNRTFPSKDDEDKDDDESQAGNASDDEITPDDDQSKSSKDADKEDEDSSDDSTAKRESESPDKTDSLSDEDDITAGSSSDPSSNSIDDEFNTETDKNFQESVDNIQHDFHGQPFPVMMPLKSQLDKAYTPYKKVLKGRMNRLSYDAEFAQNEAVHADWKEFKSKTKKQIQYLISDFERRKAAFQYSRAKTSSTGDIDLNKLQDYKFSDEIFRSVTRLADCKNHGMIFCIDYSASMSGDIFNVIDQTISLVMFCQAVGIPFQVFGFTQFSRDAQTRPLHGTSNCKNQIIVNNANMFELLSSDMKKTELDLALQHMRAQVFIVRKAKYFNGIPLASPWERMSGTPLLESIIILYRAIEKFKTKHRVQKMNVIFLTDGDGMSLTAHNTDITENKSSSMSTTFYGKRIELKFGFRSSYATLISNMKEAFDCKVICFFISGSPNSLLKSGVASVQNSEKYNVGEKLENWQKALSIYNKLTEKTMKKHKAAFIPGGFNFDCYFLIKNRDTAIYDDSFDVDLDDEDFDETGSALTSKATKKIEREFIKHSSSKHSSRVILSKFAEMIS
jgi:hypothetical protein